MSSTIWVDKVSEIKLRYEFYKKETVLVGIMFFLGTLLIYYINKWNDTVFFLPTLFAILILIIKLYDIFNTRSKKYLEVINNICSKTSSKSGKNTGDSYSVYLLNIDESYLSPKNIPNLNINEYIVVQPAISLEEEKRYDLTEFIDLEKDIDPMYKSIESSLKEKSLERRQKLEKSLTRRMKKKLAKSYIFFNDVTVDANKYQIFSQFLNTATHHSQNYWISKSLDEEILLTLYIFLEKEHPNLLNEIVTETGGHFSFYSTENVE